MPRNLGRWRLNTRTRVHKFNESESSYNRQSAFVLLHKIRENVSMISCAYSLNLETWISPSRSVFRLLFMIRPLDITAVQKQPLLPAPVTTPQTPMAPSKSKKICYYDCQNFTNKNVNQQNRLHTSACLKKRLFTWSPTSTPRLTSPLSRIISSSTTYATKARKTLINRWENIVECLCGTPAIMAGSKYGHIVGIFLHHLQCNLSGNMDAGSSRACTFFST